MIESIASSFQQTSWLEWVAVILSIIYVILAAYKNNWCWPAAAISVSLYIYIFYTSKLYSETGLQVFYLIMAFYGWWQWRAYQPEKEELKVSRLTGKNHLQLFSVALILTLIFYLLQKEFTDAALPLPDSFVTAFSLVATFLVARKKIENWIWWIVIDSLAIYIYINRNLHLTAILYFIYVIIAVVGYFNWRKELSVKKI